MDTAARIVAVCLVGALLAVLLKKTSPDMALLLALAVCLGVLAALTKGLEEVVTFLRELLEWGGLSAELFVPLLKTVGIALISRPGTVRYGGTGGNGGRLRRHSGVASPVPGSMADAGGVAVKKGLITAVIGVYILGLCTVFAWAALPENVEDALPPDARDLLEQLDDDTADSGTLSAGAAKLWNKAWTLLTAEVRSSVRVMVVLLGAVLLYGVAEGSFQAAGHPLMANFTPLAFVLVITMTAAGDVQTMIGSGTETMEQLDVLGKALLPTLAAAVAASGGIVSASARQVATVFFSNLLLTLIRNVLLPLVYFYVASAAAGAMLPGEPLKRIAAGIKKVVTWALTGSLVLFTGYLTLTGAASTSADALVLQMTRSVISTAVPVVGGIISQASGSVLSGAGLLKNSLGVFGMLAVLATCLTPFLHMAVQYLLYKVTAFLAGTAGNGTLVELIDALGSAFGLVLGMVGSCALLLLISITSSVSVVVS